MKTKRMKVSLVFIVVFIAMASFLSGCRINVDFEKMDKKIAFAETCFNDNWKATFRYYAGYDEKRVHMEQGESLVLSYSMEAEKGQLELTVKDEKGNVLLTAEDMEGELTCKAGEEANYYICINAVEAKGSFELSWEITE